MDNKVTDKGWTAMQTLLDREMPENRRRRFGWWWLGLLLLPLAVYGGWEWMQQPSSELPAQEIKADAPVANTAPNAAPNTANNPPIAQTSTIAPSEKRVSSIHPTLTNAGTNPSRQTKARTQPMPRTNATAAANTYEILSVPPAFASLQTLQADRLELHPELSLVCLPTPLQNIDFESNTTIITAKTDLASIPSTIKKAEKFQTWHIGVSSVFTTEQFNFINGYSTGATVDYKFARKWGIRSGLLYNIHTPQDNHRPVAAVQSADYSRKVEDGSVLVLDLVTGVELSSVSSNDYLADSLASNVLIPVNRLERLELPINLFWQPCKPLKLFGGVSVTRTVSTKADKQNYSGDYILKLTDKVSENGASSLSSSELNRWSADASLGAGFSLGKLLELGFVAKVPFSQFNKSNSSSTGLEIYKDNASTRKLNTPLFSVYGTLYF